MVVKFWEGNHWTFTSWTNILDGDIILHMFCVKASITNSDANALKKIAMEPFSHLSTFTA